MCVVLLGVKIVPARFHTRLGRDESPRARRRPQAAAPKSLHAHGLSVGGELTPLLKPSTLTAGGRFSTSPGGQEFAK